MHIQAKFDIQITLQNSDKLALKQNWHEIIKEIQKKDKKKTKKPKSIEKYCLFRDIERKNKWYAYYQIEFKCV